MARQFHLKRSTGWFAAGSEVERAITILSDAAFKVFIYLCLHADRRGGCVRTELSELAYALGRRQEEMQVALAELVTCHVCETPFDNVIAITDEFWPYQRDPTDEPGENSELQKYVLEIKKLFLRPRCVQSVFAAADVKLATELYRRRISLVDIERAILLGSLRKYAALLNHGGTPITSLHYFEALLAEVRQEISPEYWNYIDRKVRSLEVRWRPGTDNFPKTT